MNFRVPNGGILRDEGSRDALGLVADCKDGGRLKNFGSLFSLRNFVKIDVCWCC